MSQPLAFEYAVSEHVDQLVFAALKIEFGTCTAQQKVLLDTWLGLGQNCCMTPHFADHVLLNATLNCNWKRIGQ